MLSAGPQATVLDEVGLPLVLLDRIWSNLVIQAGVPWRPNGDQPGVWVSERVFLFCRALHLLVPAGLDVPALDAAYVFALRRLVELSAMDFERFDALWASTLELGGPEALRALLFRPEDET